MNHFIEELTLFMGARGGALLTFSNELSLACLETNIQQTKFSGPFSIDLNSQLIAAADSSSS